MTAALLIRKVPAALPPAALLSCFAVQTSPARRHSFVFHSIFTPAITALPQSTHRHRRGYPALHVASSSFPRLPRTPCKVIPNSYQPPREQLPTSISPQGPAREHPELRHKLNPDSSRLLFAIMGNRTAIDVLKGHKASLVNTRLSKKWMLPRGS